MENEDRDYEPPQDPYCWYDESDENFQEQLAYYSKQKKENEQSNEDNKNE